MPMVGGKEFPYTKKGMAAAKKEKEKEWDGPVKSTKIPAPNMKNRAIMKDFYGKKSSLKDAPGGRAEGKRMMDMKKSALKNYGKKK